MKFKLLTLLLIFISLQLYSQSKTATINGLVNNKLFTYAYLYDAESKETKVCKIVADKFRFELEQEKELKFYHLFLGSESSMLPNNQIQHRTQDYSGLRMIALENMNVKIVDGVKSAVVEAGELNKAVDEMNTSIKTSDYDGYFEKFPDSPVSVVFLKTLVPLTKHPMFGSAINVKSYYAKLSDRIKSSEDGKVLYTDIFKP
jgi:hypothetical protein